MPWDPRIALTLAVVALLGACSTGGNEGNDGGDDPPAPRVVEIQITPVDPSLPVGRTIPLTAIARYDDASTVDVTASATWASAQGSIAEIDGAVAKGIVRAIGLGTTSITALFEGVEGATDLRVDPAVLESIAVSALWTTTVAVRDIRPFVAEGTWSDGRSIDVTSEAAWTSSDDSVAVVGNAPNEQGIAGGVAPGTSTIRATLDGVVGRELLTVLPIVALDPWVPFQVAPSLGAVGIDASGRAMAIWSYQFSGAPFGTAPVLRWTAYAAPGGWSEPADIDMGAVTDKPMVPALAVNGDGEAILAWTGPVGVYAATYAPGIGWTPAATLASGGTQLYMAFAASLQVGIDGSGNGTAVWAESSGGKVFASRFDVGSGSWAAAEALPGVDRGMAGSPIRLGMNAAGAAVLVWERWGTGTPAWSVNASRFAPGSGPGTGWGSPETLHEADSWSEPAVAIRGDGEVEVVWIAPSVDLQSGAVEGRRFVPFGGWQPVQTVGTDPSGLPMDPAIALNDAGDAVVVWRNTGTQAVRTCRADGAGGWTGPETLWIPFVNSDDPTLLDPAVLSDGRIVVGWHAGVLGLSDEIALCRYSTATGWAEPEWRPIPHLGALGDARMAHNGAGDGVLLWKELTELFDGAIRRTFDGFYADVLAP